MKQYLMLITFLSFAFLVMLFIVSGCGLGTNAIAKDNPAKSITTVESNNHIDIVDEKSTTNFDLHIFTDERGKEVPCYYWTLKELKPVKDLIN